MPCFHPVRAYKAPGGGVVFSPKKGYVDRPVDLPCSRCSGCLARRASEWSLRCVHEASLHEANCFITLTYNNQNLPEDLSVDVKHWQDFAKRLRSHVGPFRYLHCGEYGTDNYRPHYHACIFGLDFREDRGLWKNNGNKLYVSSLLNKIWGKGFTSIGELTQASAAYVARYTMKKATTKDPELLRRLDSTTGEETYVRPEYITMSRRPGLGSGWLSKYKSDVYPSDQVVQDGKTYRPPRFYDKRLEVSEPELLEKMKMKRRAKAGKHTTDQTPDRLHAREIYHHQKQSHQKRSI